MGVQEFVKSCTFVKKFFLVPINLISVVQFVKITGDNHSQNQTLSSFFLNWLLGG